MLRSQGSKAFLGSIACLPLGIQCFRFLQAIPSVKMVLSGMSNLEQVVENVKTFTESRPLAGAELATLLELAERMKDAVPCTGCRYCCDGCPMGLDIPGLISLYNDAKFDRAVNVAMRVEFMPDNEKPTACIGCGKCTQICPQNIDIPGAMRDFTERLKEIPSWVEACREREKLAKGRA